MPSGSKLYQFLGIEPKSYAAPAVVAPEPEPEPEAEKKAGRPKKKKKND